MSTKFRYLVMILFGGLLSCGSSRHSGSSSSAMPGTWQDTPIAIDGDCKDWPSPYPSYDAKGKIAYATSNDRHYVYITMQTGDEMTQLKILHQGMVVSFDTSGKKEPQLHINYPLPNDEVSLDLVSELNGHKQLAEGHTNRKLEKDISKCAKDAGQFSLEGFRDCNGGYMITQANKCGIRVMLKIDEYKELVWEAAIPVKAIYNKDSLIAADAGRPLSVCYMINKFKQPSTKAENNVGMNNSMSPNMSSPGGRAGAMPSRGGGRSNAYNPLQHLYEATKTWKQFGMVYR